MKTISSHTLAKVTCLLSAIALVACFAASVNSQDSPTGSAIGKGNNDDSGNGDFFTNAISGAVSDTASEATSSGKKSADESDEDEEDEIEEPPYTPKTKSELQKMLTPIQFKVTQNEETEPAFRNKYWDNKKEGIYRCIVCGQSLFSSDTKYKSGTGWPSFYDTIKPDHVGLKSDFHLFYPRKEVHCSRCNAHLGHVFDDGPKETTGKRYCMNSAAMTFEPLSEKKQAGAKESDKSGSDE
ncbi:MAG: peptide-methionine (R)-S-oxide reductase MsrB [Planctomycetales bacterium]|nr:peptide-methionine (R)-S-oxide reductase MsrB [Planctomycetales bacterium]